MLAFHGSLRLRVVRRTGLMLDSQRSTACAKEFAIGRSIISMNNGWSVILVYHTIQQRPSMFGCRPGGVHRDIHRQLCKAIHYGDQCIVVIRSDRQAFNHIHHHSVKWMGVEPHLWEMGSSCALICWLHPLTGWALGHKLMDVCLHTRPDKVSASRLVGTMRSKVDVIVYQVE